MIVCLLTSRRLVNTIELMNINERFQAIDQFDTSVNVNRLKLTEFKGIPTHYFMDDDSRIKSVAINSLAVHRENVEADGENHLRMDVTLNLGEPVDAVAWISSEGLVDLTDIGSGYPGSIELDDEGCLSVLRRFGLE